MFKFFKKKEVIKVEKIATTPSMPSLLDKIVLEYKDDLDSSNWRVNVYANGHYVGFLKRGEYYGFWFDSSIGESIHDESRDKLKQKIYSQLERYRIFFKE